MNRERFAKLSREEKIAYLVEQAAVRHTDQRAPIDPKQAEPRPTSADEKLAWLERWNATAASYDTTVCLHQLFERRVAVAPGALALASAGQSVSYEELNFRANRLARYLVDCGVRPGDLVGICLERSAEMVAALFAILKVGAAYVPLDAENARGRIPSIATTARLRWVLTSPRYENALVGHIDRVLQPELDASTVEAFDTSDLDLPEAHSDRTAYVIFTSGSTGTPKGVQVRHRPVINLIEWVGATFGVGPGDIALFSTSLTFDLSVFDVFGILGLGGAVYIASDAERKDPGALARLLTSQPVTFWNSAPATLSLMVPSIDAERGRIRNNRLRLVFLSGDWIPLALPDQIKQHFPSAEVISLGGATEATVWSNYFRIGTIEPGWRSIPYGRPIQNARYYILDRELKPCGIGEEGDLYIGGDCLSDGYLNSPELTAAAFVPDPFSNGPARMYRTGDLARYFPDGNIEFLGRNDFQVKIRGHRIELGEIEHRLRAHDDVEEAVVVVREISAGDQALVAYVVPRPGRRVISRELREHARAGLPDYMVPNLVVSVRAFPVTDNGKIDRAALPWPPPPVADGDGAAIPERGGNRVTEAPTLQVISEALEGFLKEQLSCHELAGNTDFFDLGATSLTLTRMIGMVEQRFGVQLPLELLLETPCIDAVAREIALRATSKGGIDAPVTRGVPAANLQQLSDALSSLCASDPRSARRHAYPAAAEIYSVQVYLRAGEGSCEGLPAGVYYYHPMSHELSFIGAGGTRPELEPSQGLCFLLVAEMRALEAIYGSLAPRLAQLEAGYVAELLAEACRRAGIELEPLEDLDFEAVRPALALAPGQRFCACLVDRAGAGSAPRRPPRQAILPGELPLPVAAPSPAEQQRLKRDYPTLRPVGRELVQLGSPKRPTLEQLSRRATRRAYLQRIIPERSLVALLGELPCDPAVALYVCVRAGAVEGLTAGTYLLDAASRGLRMVGPDVWERLAKCHLPFNRRVHAGAGFSILAFWTGQGTFDRALLQAGRVGQRLMNRQAGEELGLCPVGALVHAEAVIADALCGGESTLLHAWMGGAFDAEARRRDSGGASQSETTLDEASSPKRPHELAIVGLACRFPDAGNADEFYDNLARGRSSCGALPLERQRELCADDEVQGAFLRSISAFDNGAFGISPAEAKAMDPQERLFLEVAWECLEDAGYAGPSLSEETVGVFVGAMWGDYQVPDAAPDSVRTTVPLSSFHSAIANRVSHFFDLKGPSVAVDTSCSSGMSALHLARESLLRGECTAALVGGVNLVSRRRHYDLLKAWNVLSPDGKCSALGADANGWVLGEGVAAVLLRLLPVAERHRDHVRARVCGTFLAHAGHTPRYGMLSAEAITHSIRRMLGQSQIALDSIGYVECAAAGASLGDAVELSALGQLFASRSAHAGPCVIGSVKPNVGHLESAATLSQLIKVVMQLQHQKLVPTLATGAPNPAAPLDASKLVVNRRLQDWPRHATTESGEPLPQRALITSIGATGSVGHCIVEAAEACPALLAPQPVEVVVGVSAASPGQLHEAVARLAHSLESKRLAPWTLQDVAHSLAVGRRRLAHRFAAVASSFDELRERLARYLSSGVGERTYQGKVAEPYACDDVEPPLTVDEVARLWVKGAAELPAIEGARRVPLPAYPWAREIFWIGGQEAGAQPLHAPEPTIPVAPAASLRSEDTERSVLDYVRGLFASVLEMPPAKVDPSVPFEAYGLTSLMIQVLNQRLAADLGRVEKTLFFEHRRLTDVARALLATHFDELQELLGRRFAPPVSKPVSAPSAARTRAPAHAVSGTEVGPFDVAIIGMAGRYPGASDLERFWLNLRGGVDSVAEVPVERWDANQNFAPSVGVPGANYCKWGGFVRDCERFDPLFFGMSPKEAALTDPQERMFLEISWELFERAGYGRERLNRTLGGEVGVFVGVMYGEYQFFAVESALAGRPISLAAAHGSVANRVSYFFDFSGPSMAIDTLCSSSLTALHQAIMSLKNADCRAAVVGGVNLNLHPHKYLSISQLQMASRSGRCRPFGDEADGFVPGEGVGAILIKPLSSAEADGDRILAVIKGTAVNHGGRVHAYTVPNPNRQAQVVELALRRSGLRAEQVSYVEAHGTGTPLGDPIEIAALNKVFGGASRCAIGSVKSNLGHLEAAAGIVGIQKVVLQLQHRELVPSLHASRLNPDVDFHGGPFRVQQTLEPWSLPAALADAPAKQRRACAVSSFGAGGANGHVVLEEYVAPPRAISEEVCDAPQLVLLSARTPRQLSAIVERLRAWSADLERSGLERPRLADIAYTTQEGRTAMKERAALVVRTLEELGELLNDLAQGRTEHAGIYRSRDEDRDRYSRLLSGDDGRSVTNWWVDRGDLDKLAHLWVCGVDLPWERLRRPEQPVIVDLPTYPFERQRYWLEEAGAALLSSRQLATASDAEAAVSSPILLLPRWRSAPATFGEGAVTATASLTLVAGGSAEFFQALAAQSLPSRLLRVESTEHFAVNPSGFGLHWDREEDYRALFGALRADAVLRVTLVCAWWSLSPATTLEERLSASIYRMRRLLSAWAGAGGPDLRVLCPYCTAGDAGNVEVRALGGFFRSAMQEYANLEFKLVGIDAALDGATAARAVADELSEPHWSAAEVRYSRQTREVLDYEELGHRLEPEVTPRVVETDGVYLISGASGKLGLLVARHLAERAPVALLLLGRRPLSREERLRIDEIEALGARVTYATLDLSDSATLRELLDAQRKVHGRIRGVIHAAGSLADSMLATKTDADVARVLQGKVLGLVNLDQASSEDDLEFFVLFSSLVGSVGNAGQSDYGFANAYLDHFADYRASLVDSGLRRGRTVSIAWPYWRNGGMRVAAATVERTSAQTGLEPLEDAAGLALFDRFASPSFSEHRVVVAWGRPLEVRAALHSRLLGVTPTCDRRGTLPNTVDPAAAEGDLERITQLIVAALARETGASEAEIDVDLEFSALGVTSIMRAGLIDDIDDACGVKLYVNEVQVHDTVRKLARHVLEESRRNVEAEPSTGPFEIERPVRESEFRLLSSAAQNGGPPPIFILSAPRSGSTLLRVMLMGHSQVFAPPELHLLGFERLGQRRMSLELRNQAFLREGLIESIGALEQIDASDAAIEMCKLEEADVPVTEVYRYLQSRCSPRRLVDKSPSYGLEMATLQQALEIYPDAFFVHLVRHPVATMESFVRNRFDRMIGASGDPWRIAETIWRDINRNVSLFLESVPSENKHLLRYEDLVVDAESSMRTLCAALGLSYEPVLLEPYDGDRMTQGLHPRSRSIGDPSFLMHQDIEPSRATSWKQHWGRCRALDEATRQLANQLGYSRSELGFDEMSSSDEVA